MRTVVVTGAARGLGRGIAQALLSDSRVVLADHDDDALQATARDLGPGCIPVVMDVRDSTSVERAFSEIASHSPPDALVNNAGIMGIARVADSTDEQWDAVVETNLRGAFICSRSFSRLRIAAGGGGSIVNIVSAAAESARPGAAAYAASKAGIVMLTKTLAMELGDHDITVNAVAPGLIRLPDRETREAYRAKYLAMVPLRRLGTPEDIAGAVRFLLSESARYVHGSTLTVDGGFLAGRPLE
jgi:NAD(P)-dependent dehydrogenase (short-subunit alcohol dehydrogenase family)